LRACAFVQDEVASLLFPPVLPNREAAKGALLQVVRRDPHQFAIQRSSWTLHHIREQVPDWQVETDGGMHQILDQLGIQYKRGRSYIHSPDPLYPIKVARKQELEARVRECYPREVLLYQDECGIHRQPSVGYNYEEAGSDAPHAIWHPCYDTLTRIMGTLDPMTGQVVSTLIGKVTTASLVCFYRKVVAAYPHTERFWIVQDNWPVHLHPDVLTAPEPQECIYPIALSPSWQKKKQPSPSVRKPKPKPPLPIQIVQLPTYASWLHPIEKLWRWLKHDHIHLHLLAQDLEALRNEIRSFLDGFASGSEELLHYVGLSSN
jgi:hypothetical protein